MKSERNGEGQLAEVSAESALSAFASTRAAGIGAFDASFGFVWGNGELERLLGNEAEGWSVVTPFLRRVLEWRAPLLQQELTSRAASMVADFIPILAQSEVLGVLAIVVDVTGQKATEGNLAERLTFFRFLSGLSSRFIEIGAHEIPEGIRMALSSICREFAFDRASLCLLSEDRQNFDCWLQHAGEAVTSNSARLRSVPMTALGWVAERVMARETLILPGPTAPGAAPLALDALVQAARGALAFIPLSVAGSVLGFLCLESLQPWPRSAADLSSRLQLVGDVLSSALGRREREARSRQRLRFEELLSTLSTRFINAKPDELDSVIDEALRAICESQGIDRPLGYAVEQGGTVVFRHIKGEPRVADELLPRLSLLGELVASALARQRSDRSLRDSELRVSQLIDAARDGVVIMDAAGNVIDWSPASERIFGFSAQSMIGRPFGVQALAEADRRALQQGWPAFLAQRGLDLEGRLELTGRSKDGRTFPVELSVSELVRNDDTVYAAFVRDITDRRRAEHERQKAFDELSRLRARVEQERDYLREQIEIERKYGDIIGDSPALKRALEIADAVAGTSASVLIRGESGVGKELFARVLHARSLRASGPLVKVNCASIPAALFESEFFGHVKGAFTSAHKDRVGRFELADRGTLFLDEVGEIPLELQAKLLRVLQEGEFERVGDDRTRRVDVRLIAATNRDLEREVAAGTFRSDLYYRLGVFPIEVPPLRARREDIVPLARHFLALSAKKAGRSGLALSERHERLLEAYDWPGNIRELEHVIERAVVLSPVPPLQLERALPRTRSSFNEKAIDGASHPDTVLCDADIRDLERANLLLALERANWVIAGESGAAELLGIKPSTLRDRIRAFGITRAKVT